MAHPTPSSDSSMDDINHWLHLVIAWIGGLLGFITGEKAVLLLTGIYTAANLFFILRDKWWRDPVRKHKRQSRRRGL